MTTRPANRLLIVGWDAADWKVIDPLLARGMLPSLRALIDGGVRANLASLDPKLSPILWTSIATGKTADKHGILNFLEPDESGAALRIVSSTTRRTKALWNILSQSGLRSIVVGWYATHPAEPIRGVMVSDLFLEGMPPSANDPWPPVPAAIHPPDLAASLSELRLHPAEIDPRELTAFLPADRGAPPTDEPARVIARTVARAASVHNAATALLEREPWDCAMVFYDAIDVLGHHFMQFHPPRMSHVSEADFARFSSVITATYQMHDLMLGRLLALAGPETNVLLLSDHGFFSDHLRPRVQASLDDRHAVMDATWHRHHGVLAARGPGIKSGERLYGATLLDITPTALALLGLPVGADMDGRVLVEALDPAPNIERLFSWEATPGEDGRHPAGTAIDPFEAQDAMAQLAALGYVQDLPPDAAEKMEIVRRETRFNLALVYLTTRRAAQALPLLQEVHALKPEEARYSVNLARCLHALGRFAEARAALQPVIDRYPDSPDARVLLATTLMAEGKAAEAAAALEQAAASQPPGGERIDLLVLLGEAYVLLRRDREAEPLLRRAIEADPQSARAHHALGLAALHQERFEEAVDHCLTAVGLVHFYPDAHYTMGVALTWMRDYDHAIQAFKVALSMQPGLIDAHRYLATIYRMLGDGRNAPIHRDAAMSLVRSHAAGVTSTRDMPMEPPLGPQEWAAKMGLAESEPLPDPR